MKKLTITNSDNTKMSVDLVRYFKFKTDCFLIYSIGEIDDKNYKKLYLVRIMEELGFPVVQTIKNDVDWANMQGIVKKVLKELKKGKKKLTEDLDYKEIDGIKVVDPRFFKLDSKLVDLLASNYMDENETLKADSGELKIDNLSSNDIVNKLNDVELEPIDQTMMKQNMDVIEDDSISEATLNDNLQTDNIQPVKPFSNLDDEIIESDFERDKDVKDEKISSSIVDVPIVDAITPITNIAEDMPLNVSNNQADNIAKVEASQPIETNDNISINYKDMYDSLKADNDATNELLNVVMVELNKYKEKYGELDAN